MAFLATRFTPRHRNLGRRRRRVRAEAFAADLATVPFPVNNLEAEPVCAAHWHRILRRCIGGSANRLCSGGSTRNTLPARVPLLSVPPPCSLRGCRPSPPAAVAAVALVSASGVLGVGVSYLFRRGQEAWGSFCAGPRRPPGHARVGYLPWRGCGAAEHHHLLFRQHTGAGAASKQHRQQLPAASPKEKSYPVNRGAPVAAVVGPEVAGGSRGQRFRNVPEFARLIR